MSIKVLELVKYSELGQLSIDKQVQVVGGGGRTSLPTPKERYETDLGKYANGQAEIGSNGDVVTFSYIAGRFGRPEKVVDSFRVNGDNIQSV
jgi:hypothetical protein